MGFFDIGLILASVICLFGIVRRVSAWFTIPPVTATSLSTRRPRRVVLSVLAFFTDILLLVRSARTGWMRWLAHCLVFFGFMGLLLFHALDDHISARFFMGYEPTLDPWQMLRNLFGVMVLIGLAFMI